MANTKRSTKEVQKRNLYLYICNKINEGVSISDICFNLEFKKQRMQYHLSLLKQHKVIKKISYSVWEVQNNYKDLINAMLEARSTKTYSLGASKDRTINLHALNIETKILKGTINFKDIDGYLQKSFNNWKPQYKKIFTPLGLTWRNNNNKSISIFIWSRDINKLSEVPILINKAALFTANELKKHGVIIDVLDYKVKNLNLSVKDKEINKVLNKGESISVFLNRPTTLNPEVEAKAWADTSPYKCLETNDLGYMENYIRMPENVANLMALNVRHYKNIELYNENITKHLAVLSEMSETLKEIKKHINRGQK